MSPTQTGHASYKVLERVRRYSGRRNAMSKKATYHINNFQYSKQRKKKFDLKKFQAR